MKGAVSAQKALQGLETEARELLGRAEDKSVIFYKKETEKIELLSRPDVVGLFQNVVILVDLGSFRGQI